MNKRTILIGILIVMMAVVTMPLQAQDDELTDEQMIDMVVDAYAYLNSLDSYAFNSRQVESQVISSGEGVRQVSLHRETVRDITNGRLLMSDDETPDNIDATLQQTDSVYVNDDVEGAVELVLDIQLIAVDDGLYIQINEVGGSLFSERSEAETELIDATFPTGWIILTGTPAPDHNILSAETLDQAFAVLNRGGSTPPSLDILDIDNLLQLSNSFQITEDMILSVRRAAPDVNNDELGESESDLIIVIELDAIQYFSNLGLENTFDASALAGDTQALLQQIIDGTTISQRIRLVEDPATGLLYPNQIVTTMIIGIEISETGDYAPIQFSEDATNGTPLALSMTSESRTRYTNLNNAGEIIAPLNEIEEETEPTEVAPSE